MGKLKFPASTIASIGIKEGQPGFDKAFKDLANNIANIWISAIHNLKSPLREIEFNELETDTQYLLRQAVAEAVQHAVLNKNVWERVNASSVSYAGTFAVDTTGWLLTVNMFGQIAINLIQTSGIDDYEVVYDKNEIVGYTANGNTRIIKETTL